MCSASASPRASWSAPSLTSRRAGSLVTAPSHHGRPDPSPPCRRLDGRAAARCTGRGSNRRSITTDPVGGAREAFGPPGAQAPAGPSGGYGVNAFGRVFGSRRPTPIQVRWQDGEPVEFEPRPIRRGPRYLITDVQERWIEESPWPFP